MTLLSNLWVILTQAPQIIGIIKAIIDIVGSAQVQTLLTAIRDALKKQATEDGTIQNTESERVRFFQRVLQRRTFGNLGMSDTEYAAFCYPNSERNYA